MFKKVSIRAFSAIMVLFASVLFPTFASGQNRMISGVVTDESGVSVIGAGVVVVGQRTIGTTTDIDGAYKLSVPAGATIEFSCIGYDNQTVVVGNQSVINVTMVANNVIEETVVIGYGVQKKSDLTGSVASVRSEDLQNRSTSDAASALQGKAAGVQILTNSGAPGSGAEIRVRGFSSNSGNLGPLLIVDGLKVDNIQYLDPEMIESIEVLKDAASAAIYGAQAGNGVVLVTTKSGAGIKGEGKIFYNTQFSVSSLSRKLDVMNAKDYIDFGKANGYLTDTMLDTYYDGKTDVDWAKEVFVPSWNQRHTFGVQGGNARGNYFASLNYVKNDGIFRGDKDTYNRLTFQLNADYKIKKWFTVGTNNSIEKWSTKSISQRNDNGSAMLAVLTSSPLFPVVCDYDGLTPSMKAALDRGVKVIEAPEYPGKYWALPLIGETQSANPFIQRDNNESSSGGISVRGVAYANLTPFKGFTFTSRFGYRIAQSSSHSYSEPYYANEFVKSTTYSISANANTSYYYQWENFANYNGTFGKHAVSAMAGMSYTENNSDNVSASASGSDILKDYKDNFKYLNYLKSGDGISKNMSNAPSRSAQLSYFGRASYTYDNRYSIQANFRADAFDSSKLSAKNRWGYFPSFSLGWTVSNESFVKDNVSRSAMSFLKLRASWGRNGNISVLGGYPYATTISVGNNHYQYDVDNAGSIFSSSPNGLPNPNLTWETSEQIDLGIDARFLSDRLTFGFDFYDKRTKDLLFSKPVPPELGVGSVTINGGQVLNQGVEIELGWKDNIGDFSYGINANLSTLRNEVLELPEGTSRVTSTDASSTNYPVQTVFEAGYPVWYIRGYKYEGVSEDGQLLFKSAKGGVTSKPDSGDMEMLGQGTPKLTFGLNINLAYKGFDFLLYGSGIAGNSIMPVLYRTGFKNHMKYELDMYKDGYYPSPKLTSGKFEFWSSSANIFKGDYFRIKQIQLGYTLPENITKKAAISNLRLYVSLDDFFTFTKYPGLDPETASTNNTSGAGLDWGSYPTMQKVVLGVNLTF